MRSAAAAMRAPALRPGSKFEGPDLHGLPELDPDASLFGQGAGRVRNTNLLSLLPFA
jgi:hypothetical protein